jgi:predicted hotdog family 3-hydroxylacyl-ACP dehydratase|tara:strand:+ start:96 stop:539 length:444 start_codon:yes stop_codon:yes gene_type:complete
MQLDHKEIETLIPHSGAMSLLKAVLKWDSEHIICIANSHRNIHNPLRSENILPSVCGVEYAAQAMAVHGALSKSDPNEKPRPGYLASINNLEILVSSLDEIESDLLIEAKLLMKDAEFLIYQFRVFSDDHSYLSGRAIISMKGKSIN